MIFEGGRLGIGRFWKKKMTATLRERKENRTAYSREQKIPLRKATKQKISNIGKIIFSDALLRGKISRFLHELNLPTPSPLKNQMLLPNYRT